MLSKKKTRQPILAKYFLKNTQARFTLDIPDYEKDVNFILKKLHYIIHN